MASISNRLVYKKENIVLTTIKFILFFVSSVWNQRKGFFEYIELSQKLKFDEVTVLVGVSEKQKECLPQNIVGITRTSNVRELAEIYSSADVFVNLTLEDNYPTVNLEAVACGCNVLTYDTGGSKETINNQNGSLIEIKNINKVYEVIINIRGNEYAEFCSDLEKNDANKTLTAYLSLYNKISETAGGI